MFSNSFGLNLLQPQQRPSMNHGDVDTKKVTGSSSSSASSLSEQKVALLTDRRPTKNNFNSNNNRNVILPLSMQLFKYTPGFYNVNCCPNCRKSESWNPDDDNNNNNNTDLSWSHSNASLADYDLKTLKRQKSAVSPLVLAPMMMPSLLTDETSISMMQRILTEYTAACQLYGCAVNVSVLTTIRYSLPSLRVTGVFGDADMLALAEILLQYANGPLRFIHRLDFSITAANARNKAMARGTSFDASSRGATGAVGGGIRSHGALALSKVLQKSEAIQQVFLQRNRIGPYGASALFIACSTNPTLQTLILRRCRIGERGALAFAEFAIPSPTCGLVEIDLSANLIGFKGCLAIEQALTERNNRMNATTTAMNSDVVKPNDRTTMQTFPTMQVNLEGNLVFQEIMNGVTHGLGVLLAMLGSWLLLKRVHDKSQRHYLSSLVYSTSLIVLYMSSTLYHSFFALQNTRYIFEVFDKCAIYILIAGSYTPFLTVVLWHVPLYSVYLLSFIWVCCVLGVIVEAVMPDWPSKYKFSLAMYLGMGWSCIVCLPEVARLLPAGALNLMILGGVGYTAGVPFFLRNNNLDHAIWHLFVLGGSLFHWCGIYFYVVQ